MNSKQVTTKMLVTFQHWLVLRLNLWLGACPACLFLFTIEAFKGLSITYTYIWVYG